MNIAVCVIVGIILAFIVVSVMSSGLTSVAPKRQADNYVIRESVKIRSTFDRFVRKELDQREKPKQNSN